VTNFMAIERSIFTALVIVGTAVLARAAIQRIGSALFSVAIDHGLNLIGL